MVDMGGAKSLSVDRLKSFFKRIKLINVYHSLSVIAIILSLASFFHLGEYFASPKIRIDVPERFTLFTDFGNIRIDLPINIQNIGNKAVLISSIRCLIREKESGTQWNLPAQLQFVESRYSDKPYALVGGVFLYPYEAWTGTFRFYKLLSELEEEKIEATKTKIKKSIEEKRKKKDERSIRKSKNPNYDEPPGEYVSESSLVADENLVNQAKELFESYFRLRKGDYQLFIGVFSEDNNPIKVIGFNFNLSEEKIKLLQKVIQEQYAWGEFYKIEHTVTPRVQPMTDKETYAIYHRIKPY